MNRDFFAVFITLWFSSASFAIEREDAICGSVKEPFLFWLWSKAAPAPDPTRVRNQKFIEPVSFKALDRKVLRGYKYSANDGNGNKTEPKGYILTALGNAMIADQMISYLNAFSERGYDVYIYDYRGYGNSEGKRRINAIIEDYKELVVSLNSSYKRKLLYGISMGGAVMLNVIGSGAEYDAAVIDSSPSLVSDHGCPQRIDPISNLPTDSSKLLVITGKKDPVLKPKKTSALRLQAKRNGAATIDGDDFSHPFLDKDPEVHRKRMGLVAKHFFGSAR